MNSVLKKNLLLFLLLPTLVFAQQNLPLNREWGLGHERQLNKIKEDKADTIKDEKINHLPVVTQLSCFKPYIITPSFSVKDKSRGFFYRKIKKESLIIVNDTADKFHLTIDPLFNFQYGKDLADTAKLKEKIYTNTRGFLLRAGIGKKLVIESSFYENQSTFPKYMDTYISSTNNLFPQTANYNYAVVPGQGRSKPFRVHGYDYAMASGYVSYTPFKMLNLQIGHGKHFVGDGYRSLLLSDNAFNYPYLRITTTYKNIQYTNLYTSFMNLTDGGVNTPPHTERLFQKKIGSFQMLSYNFFDVIHLGLFQGMIWEAADSTNRQHVNFNTFDPVIGVNALSYGMHNTNNVLLGATIKIKFTNSISVYGQYMFDEMVSKNSGMNKNGYQVGLKYFDVFTIKNLHLQLEYNSVSPYAYASGNPQQSYTHYNQALAHPLGANFNEAIGFINYRFKDFFIEVKAMYAVKGLDSSTFNYGGNIFRSDDRTSTNQVFDNMRTAEGVKSTVVMEDIHIGYLVNPNTNFNIVVGITNRIEQTGNKTNNTQLVYFGIRTSLANLYYDF